MSTTEYAKDLVNKFYQPLGLLHCKASTNEMWEYAKNSAIIAVNEILNPWYKYNGYIDKDFYPKEISYYQDVKEKIKQL